MTIDLSTFITISSVLVAFGTIYKTVGKMHTWVDHQDEQDQELKRVREEQCLIIYSVLACLKGLQQQGCNGEVTKAISKIEDHINKQAHMQSAEKGETTMKNVFTKKWWKAAGMRAVKTMAQVAGSMVVIGAFNETAWMLVLQTTICAGFASILTSIAGIPEVEMPEENNEQLEV